MNLPAICIHRPVLATVINLIMILLGVVAFERLTVREYPNIDPAVITVETKYPGASAQIIESQITDVLESSISGIEGIDFMRSISRQESSQITITFKLNRDADAAANDVRDRVARVRNLLPDAVTESVVSKEEADAQPMLFMPLTSKQYDTMQISDIAERFLQNKLETVEGVARVRIFGQRRYAMRIWLNRLKLASYQLTVQDVERAVMQQNIELPAGRIEGAEREFTVVAQTDLRNTDDF